MRNTICVLLATGLAVGASAQNAGTERETTGDAEGANVKAETANSVLDFTMNNIDDESTPLKKYQGKVLLVVNVASKCGLTPQYEQLEQLHEKYAERGLAILAFPANNFGGQEPGTHDQIKEFCQTSYGVKFDLFAKISVKGDDCDELYKYLTSKEKNPDFAGPIRWNFTKFLTGPDGKLIARFEPKTRPDDPEVIKAIEAALAKLPSKPD